MADFHPGDIVLFHRGTDHVATVSEPVHVGIDAGYSITTADGTGWFATADRLTLLPAGTPVFRLGDRVQICADAPHHAGRFGTVGSPEFHGRGFGYWVHLSACRVWIPAEALIAEGGEAR